LTSMASSALRFFFFCVMYAGIPATDSAGDGRPVGSPASSASVLTSFAAEALGFLPLIAVTPAASPDP
jgi:hypothetical protein